MSESLKWVFQLVDELTPSANKIVASLKRIQSSMTALTGGKKGSTIWSEMVSGMTVANVAANALIGTFHSVVDSATHLAGVGIKFAYNSMTFRENTLIGLTAMLKSSATAQEVYDKSIKIAANTPLTTEQVLSTTKQLVASGFKPNELERAIYAIGDLATVKGDSSLIPRITLAIGQVRAKGKLDGEALMRLAEAGLDVKSIGENAAKILNKPGGTKDIYQMTKTKSLKSDNAIEAILTTIEKTYGGAMQEGSKSLTGLMSTLESRPFELIDKTVASGGMGSNSLMKGLKALVDSTAQMLDPETWMGARASGAVDALLGSFQKFLPTSEQAYVFIDRMIDAVYKLLPAIEQMGSAFKSALFIEPGSKDFQRLIDVVEFLIRTGAVLLSVFSGALKGIMWALSPIVRSFNWLFSLFDGWDIGYFFETIAKWLINIVMLMNPITGTIVAIFKTFEMVYDLCFGAGASVAAGFADGISKNSYKITDALEGGVHNKIEDFNHEKMLIRSPSRLTAHAGWNLMRGFEYGINDGGGNIWDALKGAVMNPITDISSQASSAWDSLVNMPSKSWPDQVGGGNSKKILTGDITVNAPLSLSGSDAHTAEAAQSAVSRMLPTAIAEAFQHIGIEIGTE